MSVSRSVSLAVFVIVRYAVCEGHKGCCMKSNQ